MTIPVIRRRHATRVRVLAALCATAFAGCPGSKPAVGPPPPPDVATLTGTVTSTLGGTLSAVTITVQPSSGPAISTTTSVSGTYRAADVPLVSGTIAVSGVAANCAVPAPVTYSGLAAGDTTVINIAVTCVPLTGTVSGIVVSSLGGGMANVTVAVTPDTAAAHSTTTTSNGLFTVRNVPIGNGTIAVSGLPSNCATPSPTAYANLTFGDTLTDTVAVICTAPPFVNQIAFDDGDPNFSTYIAVMNPDGTHIARVTLDSLETRDPGWSPNGQRIVFSRALANGNVGYQLVSVNVDGTGEQVITSGTALDENPVWSPNGATIAFTSSSIGSTSLNVWAVNADGSNRTQLTFSTGSTGVPTWSPDGTKIAYQGQYTSAPAHIWVMNADGTNPVQLTTDPAGDGYPSWSPNGTKIAFASQRDGNVQIYVMNADGSGQTRLTTNADDDFEPRWSPDGTQILYEKEGINAPGTIWVMNADGSNPVQITVGASADWKHFPPAAPASPSRRPTAQPRRHVARRRAS
jgi:WD40-like Beta Propeller Repeat/Carboxypeptidase regulatory-like domain